MEKTRILCGIFCTSVGCCNNYNVTEELSGEQVNCGPTHYNHIMQSHVSITHVPVFNCVEQSQILSE